MEKAVIYEITATVKAELVGKYEEYMRGQHIPDLLATGYFREAAIARSSAGRYRIRYEAFDRDSLNKYLSNESARLRADFMEHFPEGVEVSREEWDVLEIWKHK